jgi:hypothetical protein
MWMIEHARHDHQQTAWRASIAARCISQANNDRRLISQANEAGKTPYDATNVGHRCTCAKDLYVRIESCTVP